MNDDCCSYPRRAATSPAGKRPAARLASARSRRTAFEEKGKGGTFLAQPTLEGPDTEAARDRDTLDARRAVGHHGGDDEPHGGAQAPVDIEWLMVRQGFRMRITDIGLREEAVSHAGRNEELEGPVRRCFDHVGKGGRQVPTGHAPDGAPRSPAQTWETVHPRARRAPE